MDTAPTRRAVLGAIAGVSGALAGCLGGVRNDDGGTAGDSEGSGAGDDDPGWELDRDFESYSPPDGEPVGDSATVGESGVPTADARRPIEHGIEEIRDGSMHVVGEDEIPAIDTPQVVPAADLVDRYDPGDPVFGLAWNGEARAYPQEILVWHEIVNDEIAGVPVAVTYCPLTGTAQGFHRDDVEFGVSGRLVNSNLTMHDRATGSWWPQVLAAAIDGPHEGDHLAEFELTWTTWERWLRAYPETTVLTDRTGYARDYGRDPYGEYNPASGYYTSGTTMYHRLDWVEGLHLKDVVIGTRTADGSLAAEKDRLRDDGLVETTVNGVPYAVTYDQWLDTGYTYRNPDETTIEGDDGRFLVEGERYLAHELPLERTIRLDAMWFAWSAYYPSTELVA